MSLYAYHYASKGAAAVPPEHTESYPPSFASFTSAGASTVAAITCNKPSGLATGDLLVFFGLTRDASATAEYSRSGWTKIDPVGSALGARVTPVWKVADSGDVAAASFEFTASGTTESAGGILACITGNAASPIAAAVELAQTAATHPYAMPASGTVTSGDYLCLAVLGLTNDGALTMPTGYTKEAEILWTPGRDFTLTVASAELTGVTSETPGDFSSAVGTVDYHAWTILVGAA